MNIEIGFAAKISTIKDRAKAWLRRDWLVILLYLLATIVTTYPLIFQLGSNWMPLSSDMYMKLWDVWWLERLNKTGQVFYYSQDLFYPVGLDLSYHPTSWTTSLLTWLFAQIIGIFSAYKVMILIAVLSSAYSAYLLTLWLTTHRIAAWFGGAVFSFAPYHLGDLKDHPDLAQMAPIPLTILFFMQALTSGSIPLAIGAGLMLGVVAWTGLYLFGFTVITLVLIFLYLGIVGNRWQQKRFWEGVVVIAVTSLILLIPRLYPVFKDTDTLAHVIDDKFTAFTAQADVLAFVIPPRSNPIFKPLTGDLSAGFAKTESRYPSPYLGLVGLATALSAVFWRKHRNEIWIWSVIATLFIVLSAGPVLHLSGQIYQNIRLPAYLLMNFEPFRIVRPSLFHLGFLLPFAVLSTYGLSRWLTYLNSRRQALTGVAIALGLFMLAEYWVGEFTLSPLTVSPVYEQFAHDQAEYALIDLPMGYSESKRYLYLQSIHGRPIVEGMSSRMPPNAFQYIKANPLLARWQSFQELNCNEFPDEDFGLAIEALMADGFRFVVVHSHHNSLKSYWEGTAKAYKDSKLSVYALADMRANAPCVAE